MAVCLSCGKETEGCLCEECKQTIDIEGLCSKIREYIPAMLNNPNKNPIWEQIASQMEQPNNFKNLTFALADYLPSPRKEYQKILCMAGNRVRMPRVSKLWFYEVYEQMIEADGLAKEEEFRLKGLMLEALYQDYRYAEADELASELSECSPLPWQTTYVIAQFFSQTRRYDEADDAISYGNKWNDGNNDILRQLSELLDQNKKRRMAADIGKKEYLPNPKENRAEAIKKYTEFMKSIGIDVDVPSTSFLSGGKTSRYPVPIPKGEYPDPIEKREADFDSFVAFDFETTGKYPGTNAIIEVGAVKVVNGQVIESEEFIFQEFVKPFKRGLSAEITKLTGITKDDLKNARQMWEVIPDFMKFVGDDILVGYNSIGFAKVICEFLEYLKLPEQYHIAREFQVYSLFQEMMPPLRQLDDIEKQQLKTITFNNVMMKAMPDQRKFIRDIKGLIKNGTYDSYFEEQQKWASVIKEKFEMTGIHSKDDIDKFAEENKVIAEELQLSMQKALIRSRSQLLKNKPAENISKSIALLTEVDARLFAKMDMEEKENLKAELDEVTRIVKNFKRMLSR